MTRELDHESYAARRRAARGEPEPQTGRIRRTRENLRYLWSTTLTARPTSYRDINGHPMTTEDWARAMALDRVIAFDKLHGTQFSVSTVWLGGAVVFETQVFPVSGGLVGGVFIASSTRNAATFSDALLTHDSTLVALQAKIYGVR